MQPDKYIKSEPILVSELIFNKGTKDYILETYFEKVGKGDLKGIFAFIYNGEWYVPKYGCDTLQMILEDELLENN